LGFYFDVGFCIACKACQIACKDKNDLWEGQFFRKVVTFESGEGVEANGAPRLRNFSGACNHCAKPACAPVCPVGAICRGEDGLVALDRLKCVGCGKCVRACPYHAVALRKPGAPAAKCDACGALRLRGQNPVCVDACITGCLRFGDLDEFRRQEGPGLTRTLPILPDPALTEPSLLIKPAGPRHE
jgi:anaerobic dimethyl sulfoxide reductase subunit B (iron-sulfur subunit)